MDLCEKKVWKEEERILDQVSSDWCRFLIRMVNFYSVFNLLLFSWYSLLMHYMCQVLLISRLQLDLWGLDCDLSSLGVILKDSVSIDSDKETLVLIILAF